MEQKERAAWNCRMERKRQEVKNRRMEWKRRTGWNRRTGWSRRTEWSLRTKWSDPAKATSGGSSGEKCLPGNPYPLPKFQMMLWLLSAFQYWLDSGLQ